MREPYTQLYIHLVWATWDRMPVLTEALRPRIYGCIREQCEMLNAKLIAIGGTDNHLHTLVRIPSTVAVAALVKQMKGASSHLVNHELGVSDAFKWQGAYAAFSVSKSLGPAVRSYILRQAEHHREGTTEKDLEIAWVEKEPGE